jgi:hypothetical protein
MIGARNYHFEKEVDYDLFLIPAPIFDERCSNNAMIELATLVKLKDKCF